MLTIKQIRDDKQAAIRKLAKKGVDAAPVIARIETLDDRRKAIQTELDNTLAAQNKAAKEIGALMGCTASQVSTYLYRGKAKLRNMLGGAYGQECLSE